MIDLLATAQVLLRDGGYSIRLNSVGHAPAFCFEDAAILGFCRSFEGTQELIAGWKTFESEVLARFAPQIRAAGDKAWNVYCVLLCAEPADDGQKRAVSWIEEDLERTRKVAACGIASRVDLIRALLPILPVQYQPVLQQEDLTKRLQRRIADIAPQAQQVVLDQTVPPSEAVQLLAGRAP